MPNLAPNSELVVSTFLRNTLPAQEAFGVGTTLPNDLATWKNGFVQVSVVGGSPDRDVPTRRPLVQVDCWVPSISNSKPAWGRAATILEDVVQLAYKHGESIDEPIILGNYSDALLQSIQVVSEPRRITNDPSGHARFSADMIFTWVNYGD